MYTKLLIFVLLGSTLVLAAPSSETVDLQEEWAAPSSEIIVLDEEEWEVPLPETVELQKDGRQGRALLGKIGKTWIEIANGLMDLIGKLKTTLGPAVDKISNKIPAMSELPEIPGLSQNTEQAKDKLAEMEKKYTEMQKKAEEAIEKERNAWDRRIEQFKKDGGEEQEGGEQKLQELEKKAEEAVQKQTERWEKKLQDMEKNIKNAADKLV